MAVDPGSPATRYIYIKKGFHGSGSFSPVGSGQVRVTRPDLLD